MERPHITGRAFAAVVARIVVRPVTAARWPDYVTLFTSRGAPQYCWCVPNRFPAAYGKPKAQKRAAMRRLVHSGTPIGVLAYRASRPVGWCSVAPREAYPILERSKTMPRVTSEPTWTVLCFFVTRMERGAGVAQALLAGAIRYARSRGARWIEAYPFDAAGLSSTHRGPSVLYRRAGFAPTEGRRWAKKLRAPPKKGKATRPAS